MTDTGHNFADAPAAAPVGNKRFQARAATRQKVLEGAARLFASMPYAEVTIRKLAAEIGMSTGAVFANFEDKAALWRAAMGSEPPLDGPVVRAAASLLAAVKGLLVVRPANWFDTEDEDQAAAWRAAAVSVAIAEGQDEEDLTECLACKMVLTNDDQVIPDVSGDFLHADCCGPEREAYVNLNTGQPIGPSEPIPTGFRWGDV